MLVADGMMNRNRLRFLAGGILIAIVFGLLACRPGVRSNFGVESWSGSLLVGSEPGERIELAKTAEPALLLNVYSPTCGPCITELPALHRLQAEAAELGVPFYLVVEGRPSAHQLDGSDSLPLSERQKIVAERLADDVRRYGIEIPILIMDDSFRVDRTRELVTGTPETMLFSTQPLVLHYNFIGPISEARTATDLESDARLQFALERLRNLYRSRDNYDAG